MKLAHMLSGVSASEIARVFVWDLFVVVTV